MKRIAVLPGARAGAGQRHPTHAAGAQPWPDFGLADTATSGCGVTGLADQLTANRQEIQMPSGGEGRDGVAVPGQPGKRRRRYLRPGGCTGRDPLEDMGVDTMCDHTYIEA
jgi:hypothetical protein